MRILIAGIAATLVMTACQGGRDGDISSAPSEGQGTGNGNGGPYEVSIRRSEYGIPHIKAEDFNSLAYGYGYAFASDNICVIADSYVTVNAHRSRYFGPDESYVFQGNGLTINNLQSDLVFQQIIDEGRIEELLKQPPPAGPRQEVVEAIKGYVDGYNRYLAEVGVDNLPDPTCRGQDWVRPITEIDAYRRFYQLAMLASTGVAFDGIAEAAPLIDAKSQAASAEKTGELIEALGQKFMDLSIGSNAIALGSGATENGKGMLLGNPHFPWHGSERFYQMHLTIPGEVNVSGGGLFGVPLVLVGYTDSMAWSHTVSTAYRFTPFELKLVPGDPTSYLVDGQPEAMIAHDVSIEVLNGDGNLETYTQTLYSTRYGPIFTSVFGLPLFPWTPTTAYALGDVNATNFRYLNHFFEINQAHSSAEALEILERNQGIPWVNTIVSDREGRALYADISVVPNVPDDKAISCGAPLGVATFAAIGLPVLDGSRSDCAWDIDEDAVQPGAIGPANMPRLFRDDYVINSNDSYWLSNPDEPLTGYARIIGIEDSPRNLRTRIGIQMIQEQLADGGSFSRQDMQDLVFNNRNYSGEMWRDQLLSFCTANVTGQALSSSGPVSIENACDVLANWDLHDNLDSSGAMLWRRFSSILLGNFSLPQGSQGSQGLDPAMFLTPFDPSDPVNTPNGLNVVSPLVQQAFGDALVELNSAGVPFDAPLRGYQFAQRGDEQVPVHGGPGTIGVFNAINAIWTPDRGYIDMRHGSSYVQVVSFNDTDCPDARTILTYSNSTNPESPHYADQTRLYAEKQWVEPPFCEDDVAAATLSEIRLVAE